MTAVPPTRAQSVFPAPTAGGGPLSEGAGPIYFGTGRRLAGWYHPATGATRLDCAVVFCGPLGYEELCAHRALKHWADTLARAGAATLRFDYDGTGNSAGVDTDGERVAAWIASVEEAAIELRARTDARNVVLAGVRLGGMLALSAASRIGADGLILLGANATGRAYARELQAFGRLMRAGDETVTSADSSPQETLEQVAGFVLTRATMADLTMLDALAADVGVRRAFVVPRDDVATDMSVADRLAAQGVDVERVTLPGYSAMMVDAHESVPPKAVIEASVQWVTAHYATLTNGRSASFGSGSVSRDYRVDGLAEGAVRESAVVFGAERRLAGVLSEPAARADHVGTGVILVNAGSVHHIGPGRMYVSLAREWAALGFSVLRMDVGGVGDSEARAFEPDNHPYPRHAVDDLDCAARWMVEHAGVTRVVLAGLCSGAHASFHAGLRLHTLAGVMVINPIVFYWNPACALDVSAWMNYAESRRYSQSARDVASWKRLARGEVDVGHAATVGYRRAREVLGGAAAAFARRLGLAGRQQEDVAADLERISTRGVTTLLVFSEGDPGLDFVRRRYAREVRLLERDRRNFAMRVVPNADHTFTQLEARDRLRQLLTTHLMERHRS